MSKVYKGKYWETTVTEYYGHHSFPLPNLYEVIYRPVNSSAPWRRVDYIYLSRESAMRRARNEAEIRG